MSEAAEPHTCRAALFFLGGSETRSRPLCGESNACDFEGDYWRGARESDAEGFLTSRESVQMSFLERPSGAWHHPYEADTNDE